MIPGMTPTTTWRILLGCWLLLSAVSVGGLDVAGAAGLARGALMAAEPAPRFASERTVLWLGQSALLPISVTAPSTEAWTAHPVVTGGLEVLEAAEVLPGHTIGYLRVRGTSIGTGTVRLGDQVLECEVRAAATRVDALESLRVVSPAPGAALWGTVQIAVQFTSTPADAGAPRLRLTVVGAPAESAAVMSAGGLPPTHMTPAEWGPLRIAAFEVDAATLTPGYHTFQIHRQRGASEPQLPGDTVSAEFLVLPPSTQPLIRGECEDYVTTSRPQRQGERGPRVQPDGHASGSRMIANFGPRPAWVLPVAVTESGEYQLFMTVRGDYAGGAFPTVGLLLGDAELPHSATRLAGRDWQRLPIGTPVHLEPGDHHMTASFVNDFFAARICDRNLYLDCFELVPVAARPKRPPHIQRNPLHADVRVAFRAACDGQVVADELEVPALCWWRDADTAPPPTVTLWVNGQPLRSQRAAAPVFWIDRGELYPGPNEVRLTARVESSGAENTSLTQTIYAAGSAAGAPPRRRERFSVYDERWDDVLRKLLRADAQGSGHRVAAYHSVATATLQLPDDLVGEFECWVEARGDSFEGAPECKVELQVSAERTIVGSVPVHGRWGNYRVGPLRCAAGPKQLAVSFLNDHYRAGVGDRNLFVRAIVLREVQPDRAVPELQHEWCYPVPEAPEASATSATPAIQGHGVDAVVVRVTPAEREIWADLEIDGRRQHFRQTPTTDGLVLLPLLLRDVAPGRRRIRVVLGDASGVVARTAVVRYDVLRAEPPELTRYERAVRLLDRFAFGVEEAELARLLAMGEASWLQQRLDFSAVPARDAVLSELATVRYPRLGQRNDVRRRVALEWLRSEYPTRVRALFWLENHFNTWLRKTDAAPKWLEHGRFAALLGAPFGEQLLGSASSPAMLHYLDQQQSFRGHLNENYGREILELHTLGVDAGYSQEDVTTAAKLLTGWTYAEEASLVEDVRYLAAEFRFEPRLGDGRAYSLLGASFPAADGVARYARVRRFLELLTRHPSTARFIATKLVEHYVAVPAPASVVAGVEQSFHESGGELSVCLLTIARHPDFWRRDLAPRVATPLDYGLRLTRICGETRVSVLNGFLNRSGMALFDRATPDGYPAEDAAYADSNAMLQRWRLARHHEWHLLGLVPRPWLRQPKGAGAATPPTRRWRQRVVDCLAVRVTGRLLSPRSNEAAIGFLRSIQQESRRKQVLEVAKLICQLPEANLR